MIRLYTEINDVYDSVRRPVIKTIITELAATLGIRRNIKVMYPGDDDPEDLPILRSGMGDPDGLGNRVNVMVKANVEYNDNTLADTSRLPVENTPIFHDRRLGVALAPMYARVKLELDLSINFQDKSASMAQQARLRQMASQQNKGMVHELEYTYPLPDYCMELLEDIYELREAQEGYDQTKSKYFSDHFSHRVHTISNRSGEYVTLAVTELQNRVLGHYDFDLVPDIPMPESEATKHVLEFRYIVEYDEPLSIFFNYPLLIHNQLLPAHHYDMTRPYELGLRPSDPGFTVAAMDFFTKNNHVTKHYHGIPIPLNDTWIPKFTPPDQFGILRVLTRVDPNDRYFVLNLRELGELYIEEDILEYIKDNNDLVTNIRSAAVYVGMWRHNEIMGHQRYMVDKDLNVYTTEPMDLRMTYRLWIAYNKETHKLQRRTKLRLAKHGHFLQRYMLYMKTKVMDVHVVKGAITPRTTRDTGERYIEMPAVRKDGSMAYNEMDAALHYVAGQKTPKWVSGRISELASMYVGIKK